ncbi:MAG: type II toxin-antitoxin system HicB family antitoxin [Chloroflexi bacterium]|nr:type II toxin-antitoxin system HicB family antitoxin [Chloroflexota bacterium]
MKYTVILLPEEDGGYSVICPALPGCASQGDDISEALAMIKEAAELWLEVWLEEGRELPIETPDVVAEEIRECLKDRAEDGLPLLLETREVEIQTPVPA